jgi:hypothetical protein
MGCRIKYEIMKLKKVKNWFKELNGKLKLVIIMLLMTLVIIIITILLTTSIFFSGEVGSI